MSNIHRLKNHEGLHYSCYICIASKGKTLQLASEKYGHLRYLDCPECGGSGELDPPHDDATRFKKGRKYWSLSQRDMAKLMGVTTYRIQRIERGHDSSPIHDFEFLKKSGWEAVQNIMLHAAANGGPPDCMTCWDDGFVPNDPPEIKLKSGLAVRRSKPCHCQKEDET